MDEEEKDGDDDDEEEEVDEDGDCFRLVKHRPRNPFIAWGEEIDHIERVHV